VVKIVNRGFVIALIGGSAGLCAMALSAYGTFAGTLKLSPTGDGIHMKVLEPISYSDNAGHELDVPANFETDGASIPRLLWTIVGSPFSGGNYVEAAVIHDEGCASHKYDWQITHFMFYEAMIDSGVDEHYAKLLYYGVRLGGPRWSQLSQYAGKFDPKTGSKTRHDKVLESDPKFADVFKGSSQSELKGQIEAFDKELRASEAAGKPITIEQIDERTESSK
jgi:hypothetical protein